MKRSAMVTAMFSAAVLTSSVASSYADDHFNSAPSDRCLTLSAGGTVTTEAQRNTTDDSALRPAEVEPDDQGHTLPPLWEQGHLRPPPMQGEYNDMRARSDESPPIMLMYGPRDPTLELAVRLSSIEFYVGISASQLDVWRAYTSALIWFFEPLPPPRAPETATLPALPSMGEGIQTADRIVTPLLAEKLADDAISRSVKARSLKRAIDDLRSTLNRDQLDKLSKVDRLPGPHDPPPGPDGGSWSTTSSLLSRENNVDLSLIPTLKFSRCQ